MWEAITTILVSQNAIYILIAILALTVFVSFFSKTGLLSIRTKFLSIGGADKERDIIRQQIEWIKTHCEGLGSMIPNPENYNEWQEKYIIERIFDEYVASITLNHLNIENSYIEIKQDKICSLIKRFLPEDAYNTPGFESAMKEDIKKSIEKLVQIRETYSK